MCAFYLLVLSAEWHAGATLGRVGLCCVSALSARPDGSCHWDRRWSNGKKSVRTGGLNSAKVACPQSHHIWRPPAAGSPCSLCPHPSPSCSLSRFPDGGGVFQPAAICVRVLSLVRLRRGGRCEWRAEGWRHRNIILFCAYSNLLRGVGCFFVLMFEVKKQSAMFTALPLTVAAPEPVGEFLPRHFSLPVLFSSPSPPKKHTNLHFHGLI